MSDTIVIRGKSYQVQSFSDLHLSTINKLLADLGDLQCQSDAGYVLKEIILPDLPVDVIRPSATGKYIVLLNSSELNDVIIAVMKVYYNRELARAIETKDKEYEAQIKANLAELQINTAISEAGTAAIDSVDSGRQKELEELAALRAENAKLKAAK